MLKKIDDDWVDSCGAYKAIITSAEIQSGRILLSRKLLPDPDNPSRSLKECRCVLYPDDPAFAWIILDLGTGPEFAEIRETFQQENIKKIQQG